MQRTKALGLLHKQIRKDSSMSRHGIPDYLVTFRKPGDNPEPIRHWRDIAELEDKYGDDPIPQSEFDKIFPVRLWQKYASPIWTDINPSDTLTYREARENEDERHICPLQLEVIRRGIHLWSNEGDTVWSPFAGIGSEGYVALQMGRKFVGSELKRSYFIQAVKNLEAATISNHNLFSEVSEADTEMEAIQDLD